MLRQALRTFCNNRHIRNREPLRKIDLPKFGRLTGEQHDIETNLFIA